MQSNSLGIKLKKTEKELKQQEQEIADQQELHQLTVKELELCKASLKISQEECQQLNGRVSPVCIVVCLYTHMYICHTL